MVAIGKILDSELGAFFRISVDAVRYYGFFSLPYAIVAVVDLGSVHCHTV